MVDYRRIALLTLTTGLLLMSPGKPKWLKLSLQGLALASHGFCYVSRAKEASRGQKVTSQTTLDNPVNLFDFQEIATDPDSFPHVLILGQTGSGKSTLAEYLGRILDSDAARYAIAPHVKPGDWQGFTKVYGGGRDYPAIAQTLEDLVAEMDSRYQRYQRGDFDYPSEDWYIDEVPAIVRALGVDFKEALASLLFEARKVRLRLFILSQGQTGAFLTGKGVGVSDLKENLVFIRLGKFAIRHASTLAGKGELPLETLEWLKSQKRPCMVGDSPAILPVVTSLPVGAKGQPKKARDSVVTTVVTDGVTSVEPPVVTDASPVSLLKQGLTPDEHREDFREVMGKALSEGRSRSYVIKKLWGYEGRNFEKGCQLWTSLGLGESIEVAYKSTEDA